MAMTPQQMIVFFGEQAAGADEALAATVRAGDGGLAALNIGEQFKCRLMQGLMGWRVEAADPTAVVRDAVECINRGVGVLQALGVADWSAQIPVAEASVAGFLVGLPAPACNLGQLKADVLLDAVLGAALRAGWEQTAWERGMAELKRIKGSALACETYARYAALLGVGPAGAPERAGGSQGGGAGELVEQAERLFKERATNGFFSGGTQTAGGGPDNQYTVDFRLAAILRKVGYTRDTIHRWRWG